MASDGPLDAANSPYCHFSANKITAELDAHVCLLCKDGSAINFMVIGVTLQFWMY